MRSLVLPLVLVSPFAIACGVPVEPEDGESSVSASNDDPGHDDPPPDDPPPPPRAIDPWWNLMQPSCDAVDVDFEIGARYEDDGSDVVEPECTIAFDDGAVYEACEGRHTFATGDFHDYVITVRDPASGTVVTEDERRFFTPPLLVDFEASSPECGLEISYRGSVNVSAFGIVLISPAENVIAHDRFDREATVQVTQPGTYTLVFDVEDERSIPICSETITRTVTVHACPHGHPPDPHCPH